MGFYNRKYFVLFLMYTLLSTLWVLVTFMHNFVQLPAITRVHIHGVATQWSPGMTMMALVALLLDGTLSLMLLCFFSFHLRMVMRNETTIEGPSPEFDVGTRRNWEQVFGADPWLWFLPVWGRGPAGDGVRWPTQHDDGQADDARGDIQRAKLLDHAAACSDSSD